MLSFGDKIFFYDVFEKYYTFGTIKKIYKSFNEDDKTCEILWEDNDHVKEVMSIFKESEIIKDFKVI